MGNIVISQDNFTKGELSPMVYARNTLEAYYLGLRQAYNCVTYPQGAVGKRWGTYYRSNVSNVTNALEVFFADFNYSSECTYQLIFRDDNIDIYLEGILAATVSSTGMNVYQVQNMDYTVLENRLIVTTDEMQPKELLRSASATNAITGFTSDTLTVTSALTVGRILPVRFTTTSALPTSTPQIFEEVTYFANVISANSVKIYTTSREAAYDLNPFTFSNAGTGTNNLIPQNTWTFQNISFRDFPAYDFEEDYLSLTFTPSATYGTVTLTASSAFFEPRHVGGVFVGGGGAGRITAIAGGSPPVTSCTLQLEKPFTGDLNIPPAAVAIPGRVSFVGEPAWSDARGYPRVCSSNQNRLFFSNSNSLENGVWGSAINDYNDFNDIERDDDDAISWYPTSNNITFIRFIVPYRSLTVHTNSGVFSTPLSVETALTPSNFSLNQQDSTPADVLEPQSIDNQIVIVSGNDVHTLLWDGLNNAYTSSLISVVNEHLIRDPVDELTFTDNGSAGSRYVFIINGNGSLAIYQTLISERISGWVPAGLEQSYGSAYFRQGVSSLNGRAWFLTEREIATAQTPIQVTAVTSDTMTAVGSNFDTENATAVKFTASGDFPTGNPVLEADTYYWVIGIDADTFYVYTTQTDAENDTNRIEFIALQSTTNVVPWPLETNFYIEELTYDTHLDCAERYVGSATDTITGVPRFNAQNVKMVGDGFGFEAQGNDDEVVFKAHGENVDVSNAFVGFPINSRIEPLAISVPKGDKSTLTRPNHVRNVNLVFNNTIGGEVNGQPVALNTLLNVTPGDPPQYSRGIFKTSVLQGWDDYNNPPFVFTHEEPFNFELLGLFYTIDVY